MSFDKDSLSEAVRSGLEEELLPILKGVEEDTSARLRLRMDRDLPELAARISSAALRGEHSMVDSLESVPHLWLEQERVRVTAVQAEAIRATVRTAFRVLANVIAAA